MTLLECTIADPSDTDLEPVGDESARSSFARCADGHGTLAHLFFSDDEFDVGRAKAICARCGLADACLEGALDRAEPYGVWGGQLLVEGVVVAVKRGRGRPPKHPRPVLVVDEVPVPPHLVASGSVGRGGRPTDRLRAAARPAFGGASVSPRKLP